MLKVVVDVYTTHSNFLQSVVDIIQSDNYMSPILDNVYNALLTKTQLSLTNRATRLEVSQGQQTFHQSIC